MDRLKQYEEVLRALTTNVDGYHTDAFAKVLTDTIYPEYKDYHLDDCNNCRKTYFVEQKGWRDGVDYFPYFCTDDCKTERQKRKPSKSMDPKVFYKIMHESMGEAIKTLNETPSPIWEMFKGKN